MIYDRFVDLPYMILVYEDGGAFSTDLNGGKTNRDDLDTRWPIFGSIPKFDFTTVTFNVFILCVI